MVLGVRPAEFSTVILATKEPQKVDIGGTLVYLLAMDENGIIIEGRG
jgi:hypothetical protein